MNTAKSRIDRFPANGEVIVTLLPVNERFPWVTPARFRPELVPEELMAPVLTVNPAALLFFIYGPTPASFLYF